MKCYDFSISYKWKSQTSNTYRYKPLHPLINWWSSRVLGRMELSQIYGGRPSVQFSVGYIVVILKGFKGSTYYWKPTLMFPYALVTVLSLKTY